jgi:hypothetical protein
VHDIVEVGSYPTDGNPKTNQLLKTIYTFLDPSIAITGGISNTSFTVSTADAARIMVGLPVNVRDSNYTHLSPDNTVVSVVGTTVTVKSSLGFTPTAGMKLELVGFNDNGGPYRWV